METVTVLDQIQIFEMVDSVFILWCHVQITDKELVVLLLYWYFRQRILRWRTASVSHWYQRNNQVENSYVLKDQ